MGVIGKRDKRRIIPRWRGLSQAAHNGELNSVTGNVTKLHFNSTELIEEQINSWNLNQDISHAGDLLSSAYVIGVENDFWDVAKYIMDSDTENSSPLRKLAARVLKIDDVSFSSDDKLIIPGLASALDKAKYRGEIQQYKSYLKHEAKNPIAWIELGRLYSLVGLNEKAEKCVNNALFLDKNNRFIVRSASRFFHHNYPYDDKALQIIKKSEYVKTDPWLLSAEIAYSSILERRSTLVKIGAELVKNSTKDYISITELSSALGTLELMEGSVKAAKKYFSTSLIKPNDNSIAQASWAAQELNSININLEEYNLPLAFEAHAQLAFNEKNYKEAYQYSLMWLADEPFSSRPIKLASHVSCLFLEDTMTGIELLRAGLTVNPDDPHLNNNLIYYLAKNNRTKEAVTLFETKLKQHINGDIEIKPYTVLATAGLLAFRTGYPDEGRKFYGRAMDLIKQKSKSIYLMALANLNLIEEELGYAINSDQVLILHRQLEAINIENYEEDDLRVFYRQVSDKVKDRLIAFAR